MNTLMKDILTVANDNSCCWLATIDDVRPRLRPMQMWFADSTGFYFHTGKGKNVCRQLMENPLAEASFSTKNGEIVRVSGAVEFPSDSILTERLFRERPWVIDKNDPSESESDIVIFRIVRSTAYLWTSAYNARENDIPRVYFH